MAKRKYKVTLSLESLEKLEKELKNLEKEIDNGIETTTRKLGKKSLDYMKKQYSLDKNNMEGHTGNIKLIPYKNAYKNGFIISSGDDEIAVYNEFGTGIVGLENPNPLANDAGYRYNMDSPHKGVIPEAAYAQYPIQYLEAVNTPNTWWYFKNGKWWHTEGMKGKQMYSSLVEKLNENAVKDFKANINQIIGE